MDPLTILLFVILFMLSAFFSGTELALMSLPEHKIDGLLKQNKYWAKSLKKIKENNDRLLITILIWNNLVNVYTAALATTIAISLWEASGLPQATAVWIATWVVTFLLLLFGEIIPKSFATKNAASLSLLVAPVYKILMTVLWPVITFMEVIIRIFSWKKKVEQVTEEEIESFIDMGRDSGTLEKDEHQKIKNILEFDETHVDEIMIPRVKIEAISDQCSVQDALDYYLKHTHSRIPVYRETIDHIDYFITGRDLIIEQHSGNWDKKLSDIKLKEVLKVPLNQTIEALFKTFQNAHKIMAIVIDEYGGVAWLVTMEDVIEEVFWEIRDETDKELDQIKEIEKNILHVRSRALIEDVLDRLHLDLDDIWLDSKEFDGETINYVITHELARFPEEWEVITFNIDSDKSIKYSSLELTVINVEDHKIHKVEVKKI